MPQPLGEREQRLLAVAPVEVRAGHDHRALGLAQQRRGALDVGAPGRPRRRAAAPARRRPRPPEDVVHREVDERRARVRRHRAAQRLVDQRRDLAGRSRRVAANLVTGRTNGHVVDLLQRALAPSHRRRAAAEDEHRRVVLLGRGHRAHPVGHAGTGRQRGDARLPGDLRPALGGERGGRLVAHVDEVDPLLATAVVDREQVPAGEREQLGDAVRLQAPGDQPPSVQPRRAFGVRGHRPDPIDTSRDAVEGACTPAPTRAP